MLPPQKVAEVVIRGNERIPSEQVLAVVSTKVADPLNEEKLRNDVQAILNLGVFADAVVRIEPVPEGVRVVFVVVENPVIQKIEVKGNSVISTADILKALGVQVGAVLNTVTMRAGVRAVEKLYQDQGYVLAHITDVNVSPEGVLTLQLAEGRIEAIRIDGVHKTHEYVVRRELTFKPGDVFNVNEVNASLKRLFQLQYFSDVKAQPGPGTAPDTVDVTIVVTEQKTATVSFGVGYSNQTGIEGFVGVRDTDFGGNGQSVSIQYSNTALFGLSYGISFREPYFLGSRTILELQLFNQTTVPTDYSLGLNNSFQYDATQVGGIVSFTTPLGPINTINYGVKFVTSTFGPPLVGTSPPAGFPFTPGQVNALILGVAQDTRNDPQTPISGERLSLGGEFAAQVLGGTFQFRKYDLDYAHFFPLGVDTTIVGHVHLGYSDVPLPLQEQFYLGGQSSLRGFATGRYRGDEMVLLQTEYRFPLSVLPFMQAFTGITTVLFIDAGDTEPAGATSFSLKPDVGLGIQVKSPIGPFRIDYGISGDGQQFWVSTGVQF
jgi:outer membrane protein insertion porin family